MRLHAEGILGLMIFLIIAALVVVLIPSILLMVVALAAIALVIAAITAFISNNPLVGAFRKRKAKKQKSGVIDVEFRVK